VLRADVDDLGATFVSGLPDDKVSISRTSTLSRSLSVFFKSRINEILQQGGYQVQIIYSGGDDLFIIGNWSDILYAAIDIRNSLDAFTGNGSLTLSAGIGMFDATYPIARMASEVGLLEDAAKGYIQTNEGSSKNAVALWSVQTVFGWDEFIQVVMPLVDEMRQMFQSNQKGNAFIYRLIALLRDYDSLASAPRLAYLLARSFEGDNAHGEESSKRLYALAQDSNERYRLITALEWYVYSTRKESER
jgi:CRISPR-associated protein Csm1